MIFCLCCVIFHLANAAMLPLVGQKLTLQDKNQGTALMSACIVAAQAVMVPMAMLVGRKADVWGRKPLFLAGFAINRSPSRFQLFGPTFRVGGARKLGELLPHGLPGTGLCRVHLRFACDGTQE
jgi:MFS family permease